jgi:hypothetical protein
MGERAVKDTILFGVMVIVAPLLMIAIVSFGLRYFIALNARPSQRAAWIAGIAYLATTIFIIFGGAAPPEYAIFVPLAALPGGLVAYWFWRREFRQGWIENAEDLPEGVTLANDDWRMGLLPAAGIDDIGNRCRPYSGLGQRLLARCLVPKSSGTGRF